MGVKIPEAHPLRKVFRRATNYGFFYAKLRDWEAAAYISDQILTEFIHIDNLYRIRDSMGRRLEDVAEILLEAERHYELPEREREIHRYIGDYTLFMTGFFPESLSRKKGCDWVLGSLILPLEDPILYYVEQGRRSYLRVSELSKPDENKNLFRKLSEDFEQYCSALNLSRAYLDSLRCSEYEEAKRILSE